MAINIFENFNQNISKNAQLTHYTSMYTLDLLLRNAKQNKNNKLTFHATQADMMNDGYEWKWLHECLQTYSDVNKELMKVVDEVEKEMGKPYVISFIPATKTYHKGRIPMWLNYADCAKGVCLHFDAERLRDYCNNEGITLKNACI